MPRTQLKRMLRTSNVDWSPRHTLGGLGGRISGDELQVFDNFELVGTRSSRRCSRSCCVGESPGVA
ncbi:hypothetical protein SAMN05192563_1024120 [Paraburkholderia aspalathi]|uniref:Uncharacterized protein n=1 Tax=Paraburkholderia aspalathi TaxID=1324617 RepID=A0A1I7EJD4_9BURK|nr:hypothetical protein SAMN05192563_1024120 [Paraburkholderia aspalathi]